MLTMLDEDARRLLGSRILAARRAAGLGRVEVAGSVGTSAETLAQYERGQRTPTVERLCDLARVLGTDAKTLMDGVRSIV